jgi:hypothetical protein
MAALTAGSVELTVRALGPSLHLLGLAANWGSLGTDLAQIRYSKINGSNIVNALHSNDPVFNVPTGTNYFLTNPAFSRSYYTALWVVVDSQVPAATTSRLEVRVRAANAPEQTLNFDVPIRGGSAL